MKALFAILLFAFCVSACKTIEGAREDLGLTISSTDQSEVTDARAAFGGDASSEDGGVTCLRDEQEGCLSLQVLNLEHDGKNPLMRSLVRPVRSEDERYRRVVDLAPRLYASFKEGRVNAAGPAAFVVYMWNVRGRQSGVREFRYDQKSPRNLSAATRHVPASTRVGTGPEFDPVYDIGSPQMAYRIQTDGLATVIGIPWHLIGDQTYILVCPEGQTIYPNRRALEGIWVTPEFLNAAKQKGHEYILVATTSR